MYLFTLMYEIINERCEVKKGTWDTYVIMLCTDFALTYGIINKTCFIYSYFLLNEE